MSNQIYVVKENVKTCNVCREQKDTRCGACFDCAEFVDGVKVSETKHRLWDKRNPENVWYVYA